MTDVDIRRHSVESTIVPTDGTMSILIPWTMLGGGNRGLTPANLPDMLPASWRERDRVLRDTIKAEGVWGSAVAISVDKLTALDWKIMGDVPLRVRQSLSIVTALPFIRQLKKLKLDFHTTNNGAFLEIIRASSARGSKILGIAHLDSTRCQRTGDPEIPVLYTDRAGKRHEMRWWQVVALADMESADIEANGMGWCSAARAYHYIKKLATIESYIYEKVAGKRPLAIELVNVAAKTLESGIKTAEAQSESKNAQSYMGAVIISVNSTDQIFHERIDLAGLPDGFDGPEEWRKTLLVYAKVLGLDPQDVQPLTGQALGTGAQSKTLDEKAKRADAFQQEFEEALRDSVLVPGTTFTFVRNDLAETMNRASVAKLHTDDVVAQVGAGILQPAQALQMKVDWGENPTSFLTQPDSTPTTSVDNEDNPEDTA